MKLIRRNRPWPNLNHNGDTQIKGGGKPGDTPQDSRCLCPHLKQDFPNMNQEFSPVDSNVWYNL